MKMYQQPRQKLLDNEYIIGDWIFFFSSILLFPRKELLRELINYDGRTDKHEYP